MATPKQMNKVTTCIVCTEVYTDPRVLPCGHTYCLKCLETYSKDKQPGDELACPVCRKEFILPRNGVSDLPKNFFLADLLQMKKSSSIESKMNPCEACSGGKKSESMVKNVAAVYCVECKMKLCHNCEKGHKAIKMTRSHKIVKIGEKINVETHYKSTSPSCCDQHHDRSVEIYCFECKSAICMMCYIEVHNTHKCSDIKKVEDDFCKQMKSDGEFIAKGVEKCREMLKRLDKERHDFHEQIAKTATEISEKAEQLKQMIDDHKEKLMNELSSMKQKRMKEIESLREEIERQLMSMESYKKYVDEVRQKGTACDIARAASGLHDRADELLKFDVIERTLADLGHADVTFTSSNYVIDDVNKTLGQLRINAIKTAMKSRVPTLTHVIPSQGRASVYAAASLGDDVLVVRNNSQQVEVYDAETFMLKRNITVPGLGPYPRGLAACTINYCIYVSEGDNSSIHRVELSGSKPVKKWSVAKGPRGLSVNKAHNLVVACCGANKLQEYTTHGSLVREISLQAGVATEIGLLFGPISMGVTDPWHAVQLSTGHYVVSQDTSPGVVSVVGVDGQVVHSYRQSRKPDVGQMKYPRSLAVTKNDDILVADECNNRILSIIRSTGCVQELALSVDGGIQAPMGLCLDESRGRLYVAEYGGQHRVLVFDGVKM